MFKFPKVYTYNEIKENINDLVNEKQTPRSKKILLGKLLREDKQVLEDQRRAWDRPIGDRWLHGEQVTKRDINNTETEIQVINDMLNAF